MKPEKLSTLEGRLQFIVTREMLRGLASHCKWVNRVSSFGLIAAGGFASISVANLDKLSAHLHRGWEPPLFSFLLCSSLIGVALQAVAGFTMSALTVEDKITRFLNSTLESKEIPDATKQQMDKIIAPALVEFIESRPRIFRWKFTEVWEKSKADVLYMLKVRADVTQFMFLWLLVQYVLLVLAFSLPIAFLFCPFIHHVISK
jgi:hypothetical protein